MTRTFETFFDYCCSNCNTRRISDKQHKENYFDISEFSIFYVCRLCGNKRCPKATDHRYRCNQSNKSDQLPVLEGCSCVVPGNVLGVCDFCQKDVTDQQDYTEWSCDAYVHSACEQAHG